MVTDRNKLAVWAVTPNGLALAGKLRQQLDGIEIYCSRRLAPAGRRRSAQPFDEFLQAVATCFHQYRGHIFITAVGIAVRAIGTLLRDKSTDPAVICVDDQARFAVSLVSGHIGGANQLAEQVACFLGARAVITSATDINQRPAVDVMAMTHGFKIENPASIKKINMALLLGEPFPVYDPQNCLPEICLHGGYSVDVQGLMLRHQSQPGVYVGDRELPLPPEVLILRPSSLVVGLGCNRGTDAEEMRTLLERVLVDHHLSQLSLNQIASIDIKRNESGLTALAQRLGVTMTFFTQEALNQIHHVPNPSTMVLKHVGVQSVCEAAAILAAHQGSLIVPKQKTVNVTLAIARRNYSSSESGPAA